MATDVEVPEDCSSNDSIVSDLQDEDKEETNEEDEEHKDTEPQASFATLLTEILPHDKVISIRQDQAIMLQTLELANWKLSSLNDVSESTYQRCALEFRQTTKTLSEMKKQLDSIFRRIRHLKAQVAANYPEAYATIASKYKEEYNEFDDEDDEN